MRAYAVAPEILGSPVFLDRYSTEGKEEIVALLQDVSAAVDCLVLCRFLQFAVSLTSFTEMLNAVTGMNYTDEELLEVGRRVYNLERKINCEAGLGKADDMLPSRFLNEELKEGASRNRVVQLDKMLNDYYKLRGWDEQGVPTQKTLDELGI